VITVKLEEQFGRALRQYKKDADLPITEIVQRALICYWLTQNNPAASFAVNTASQQQDEPTKAYIVGDDEFTYINRGGHDENAPGLAGALNAIFNRVKITA
jgi:hypothetical protein